MLSRKHAGAQQPRWRITSGTPRSTQTHSRNKSYRTGLLVVIFAAAALVVVHMSMLNIAWQPKEAGPAKNMQTGRIQSGMDALRNERIDENGEDNMNDESVIENDNEDVNKFDEFVIENDLKQGPPKENVVLVLASHRALVLYNVDSDEYRMIDSEKGLYYGLFPGDSPNKLWVSKSISVGRKPDQLALYQLDKEAGLNLLKTVPVQSRYMHDAVTSPDRSLVFVADVKGSILVLNGKTKELIKRLSVFTESEHLNTLAVSKHGTLWCMLHNTRAPSKIVQVDPSSGEWLCELTNVGQNAHGLVFLENDTSFLILSSKTASLVKVQIPPDCVRQKSVVAKTETLWTLNSSPGNPKFLKGLAVVDKVAYFGMSDFMTRRTERMNVVSSIVAYDLYQKRLLWIRGGIGTKGIVNVIAAPYAAVDSTYRSISRSRWNKEMIEGIFGSGEWQRRSRTEAEIPLKAQSLEMVAKSETSDLSTENDLDSTKDNSDTIVEDGDDACVENYLDELNRIKLTGLPFGSTRDYKDIFYRLPLSFDTGALQREALTLREAIGFSHRKATNEYSLQISHDLLSRSPYIRKVIDSLGATVSRCSLEMVKAGETFKPESKYQNKSEWYHFGRRFRIHIPIITHSKSIYRSTEANFHLEAGVAFMANNLMQHSVTNNSPVDQIHLIIDTIGSRKLFELATRSLIYRQDGAVQGSVSETRIPSSSDDVKLIFEDWVEQSPLVFASTEAVRNFAERNILNRIQDRTVKISVTNILEKFFQLWGQHCSTANQDKVELLCGKIAEEMLEEVLLKVSCNNHSKQKLLDHSSLSIADAVEVMVRLAYFSCFDRPKEELGPTPGRRSFLPIPGSPYRRPLCFTSSGQVETVPIDSIKDTNVDPRVCTHDFFKLLSETKENGSAFGTTHGNNVFFKLPLHFDVAKMQEEADWLNKSYGFTYRSDVNNYFILLATREGNLNEDRTGPFLPVPNRLSNTPYLRRVVDSLGIVLGRSRFMMLKAGENVKGHVDDVDFLKGSGYGTGYWGRRFRIHVPIYTDPEVFFGVSGNKVHMEAGYAYLFDNGQRHYVENHSQKDRVHLIMDTVGSPRLFRLMQKGTIFTRDGTEIEGSTPVSVPASQEDVSVQPFYEDWVDSNAFEFMPIEQVQGFLSRNIIDRLESSSGKKGFENILKDFFMKWETSCGPGISPDLSKCNSIVYEMLRSSVEKHYCAKSDQLKLRDSSIHPVELLEVISRQLFFACGNPPILKEAMLRPVSAIQTPEQELILPVPGNKFSLPLCKRSKNRKGGKGQKNK